MAEHITRNDGGAGCRYGNKNRIGQTSIFIVYAVVAQSVEQLIRNYQTGLQKIEYATVAQSVEQLIRNQQVVCSSHISSSRKRWKSLGFHRFLNFFDKYLTRISFPFWPTIALLHIDSLEASFCGTRSRPTTWPTRGKIRKRRKSAGRKIRRSRCVRSLPLHHLRHEAAHGSGGLLLLLAGGMGIGAEGKPCI